MSRLCGSAACLVLMLSAVTSAVPAEEAEFGFTAEEMFPAVSFEPLTPVELDSFIEVFPCVAELLEPSDYDMDNPDDASELPGLLVGIIEGLREVDGVEAALSAQDMTWDRFSATVYKIMAAYFIVAEDIFSELAAGFSGGAGDDKAAKNRREPPSERRAVLEQNLLLMKAYEERFEDLGDILR